MEAQGRFEGFSKEARDWFEGLELDNSRDYFQAHRDVFEASVRDPMLALLGELSDTFGGEVKLFRQHRDTRFSQNKAPYKTNTYGVIRGAAIAPEGLYVSISAHDLTAGSGFWRMESDQLERFREAVAAERTGTELEAIVADGERAGLEVWGMGLKTAPRGYAKDHPRVELLRRKNIALGKRLPFGRGIGRDRGLDFARSTLQATAPLNAWLAAYVGATTEPPGRRR